MGRARSGFAVIVLTGVTMAAAPGAADASWRSSVIMGTNQGYCRDGHMRGDVSTCPENRKGGAARAQNRKQRQPGRPTPASSPGYFDPDS